MWISTGKSRKETKWKNTDVSWEKFVERLKQTKYTEETHDEYVKLKKPQQDEIKDVGGFVGGSIFGGRRKAGSVTSRSTLTLDLDKVRSVSELIDEYQLVVGASAVFYSTHKHTPENPRLRLVVLLDHEVQPDAYEAIGRRVAEWLDIEQFDPTTFQPERLMYWPSTSKDGEFFFKEIKGSALNTSEVLATYKDWTDATEWPVSQSANDAIKRHMKKQGDPLEKPGVIGFFCRSYGVDEAIEKFLKEVYLLTDHDYRYTYAHGTTSAGVVVYENKFAFSHHSTDPCSMKLCNAFDLVRIHLFGDLDKDSPDEVPSNKLPSFLKMTELANKDKKVKRLALSEQINSAKGDFGDNREGMGEDSINDKADGSDGSGEPVDESWMDQLEVDRHGKCLNTINNAVIVLENDPLVKNIISYNDFDKRITLQRSLPWRRVDSRQNIMTDSDDASFRNYFEVIYKITGKDKIEDAINIVSRKHVYHPIRDYLAGLKWDGKERLSNLLIDFLGAENTKYTRAVTTKAFTAAVARVLDPGIKFDHVLTFSGKEGAGKSYLLSKMGMQWHSDSFGNIHTKEAVEQVQGVWIVEVGELFGFKKAEAEAIKLFLSKREDRFRVAYGRRVEVFPRQCVFFGTTEEDMFLKSVNGNRRFWPVKIDPELSYLNVFKDLTQDMVDQVWAEACEAYKSGEKLYLSTELEDTARVIRDAFIEQDERKGMICRYLYLEVPSNWESMSVYERRSFIQGDDELSANGVKKRDKISIPEIWTECLGNSVKDMSYYNCKFIRDIMNGHSEWRKRVVTVNGFGPQRGYVRLVTKKCNKM